jgi:hypothetical protein
MRLETLNVGFICKSRELDHTICHLRLEVVLSDDGVVCELLSLITLTSFNADG